MECSNCKFINSEGSKFCTACGNAIATTELVQKIQTIESYEKQEINDSSDIHKKLLQNEAPPTHDNNVKHNGKPLSIPILVFTIFISILFLSGAIFLFFNEGNVDNYQAVFLDGELEGDTEESTPLEKIFIAEKEIVLSAGKSKQINVELYPDNAEFNDAKWESSGHGVTVSGSGRITALIPGYEATVTVSNATFSEKVKVRVLTEDEAFFETIDWISNKSENEKIDLFEDNFLSRDVNSELKNTGDTEQQRRWSLDLFTETNDEISSFNSMQKQLINKVTGNKIDCDVYTHQTTGDIRKIVTIEYHDNYIEITDYYYANGKVGFVFNRNENYYRPVAANWGITGVRLYFEDDSMVMWRDIINYNGIYYKTDHNIGLDGVEWTDTTYNFDTNGVSNEVIHPKTTGDSEQIRAEKLAKYGDLESRYIDAAYNIYNKVTEMPDTFTISSYAIANDSNAMSGVTVKVFSEQYGMLVSQSVSDADGAYSVTVPRTQESYTIALSLDGYITTWIYDVESEDSASNNFVPVVYMLRNSNNTMPLMLSLTDAVTGHYSDIYTRGAELRLREGINNKGGDVVRTIRLLPYDIDSSGSRLSGSMDYSDYGYFDPYQNAYRIALKPGNYTSELVQDGTSIAYFTISTIRDNYIVRGNVVPKVAEDEIKVVLSWSDTPTDLDSHLFYPNGNHIAYYNRNVENDTLDVDCTSGYGPETITISSIKDGTYKYYVADFSNCSSGNYGSFQMSNSFANVSVYTKDGLVRTFNVPRNQSGVIWHVFDIANGKIVPVERYYNNIQDMQWWSSDKIW